MDAAVRVEKMNEARDKIGGEPFLRGDAVIKEAFEWGLCQELVLNETYDERLQSLKDAKRELERIAADKRAEEKRIYLEKLAEEQRIAAEKQRIADTKPSVKEEFWANGKLKSRMNYQSKTDGGKLHGPYERYYENGQLWRKENYKDGKLDGLYEWYHENGQLELNKYYKEGKVEGLSSHYDENGRLVWKANLKDGKLHGLFELSGPPVNKMCYKNGELDIDMSSCEK